VAGGFSRWHQARRREPARAVASRQTRPADTPRASARERRQRQAADFSSSGTGYDPAKVAQVILRVADEHRPPVRLLLGSDAVFLAAAAAERAEEGRALEALSISTDYDRVGDFAATDGADPVTRPRA
jgi:hypothetical protein